MGDGVLASFATVTDAVYCAKEIQKTCQDDSELNLRIGIHQGEVVFDGEDVFGSGVNIASRIEPLSAVGGILVTEAVHNNLANKKDVESTYAGEKQLKNVKKPVKVYQVQVDGVEATEPTRTTVVDSEESKSISLRMIGFTSLAIIVALVLTYFFYSQQSEEETQAGPTEVINKSIAVLPFINDSPDPDNEYFCNGMFEEIITHIQKIADLKVKSRTSVEQYRNPTQGIKFIGSELGVAFLVEGSVRKVGDNLRITAQLIDAKTGDPLWAETYDGKYTDKIFEFQSNIAKQVAGSLSAVITPDEEEVIDKIPTTDIAAYDLYIRANHERWIHVMTGEDKHAKTAHDLFDKALRVDPNYLMAIVGKGQTFLSEQKRDSAFIYAERAIVLDQEFNRGYGLKGECYSNILISPLLFANMFDLGQINLAIEYFLKAINLPPKDDFRLSYHVFIRLSVQHFKERCNKRFTLSQKRT